MRKIKRHLGKNIGKGTAKIAGLALAFVIAAGSAFGVTGVSAMAADDAGITNTQGDGAEESGEEPTGENQPGTEESGEEPTGENQPGTEEPGEEPTGENQPGTEEPIEIQPDIMEEPVLNLIQTEGGTVTAEPFESVFNEDYSESYDKSCYISAEADEGWYFKKWNIESNEAKGTVSTYATNNNRKRLSFFASTSYKADSDILTKLTYGTANVSAVFEKLNEGEYVITGLNGSEEENIVARAGEKVTITLSHIDPRSNYDVHYESDASKKIEFEIDPTQKTISFIMPESNVIIGSWSVLSAGGSSKVPSEEITATPGGDTGEESDGTTENTDEKVKKEDNDKNGTTTVEENNTDQNDSEAKSAVQGAERMNTAVSTTAAPVKAGTPVSVYSAPVRNAGGAMPVKSAGSSTTAAQTGDKTNAPLWIAAAAGSVVAVLGAFVIRRKKNSEE